MENSEKTLIFFPKPSMIGMVKRFLFFLWIPYVVMATDPEPILLEWKLDTGQVLELREHHTVLFRSPSQQVNREDKNRVTLKVLSANAKSIQLEGIFDTYVRYGTGKGLFRKDKTFESKFQIARDGIYTVPEEYSMPNLRSLPGFLETKVRVGDTWKKRAEESFDLPGGKVRVSVNPDYVYSGPKDWEWDGYKGTGEKIDYSYTMFYENASLNRNLPDKIYGFASGAIYWDKENGVPQYKDIKLSYTFVFPGGVLQEANFSIKGIYFLQKKATDADREKIGKEIANFIRTKKGIKEGADEIYYPAIVGDPVSIGKQKQEKSQPIQVRKTSDGVTISLNSILFDVDKKDLKPEAKKEIEAIAEILNQYPEREIRITGHTDNQGKPAYNQKLSEDRARTVLESLREKGVKSERMSFQGLGDTMPIDTNETEEGRARNRRVEITLVVE